jgi:hypothetical protein
VSGTPDASGPGTIVERNIALLLSRTYSPVQPSPAFRARLAAEVHELVAARAAPARSPARSGPPARSLRPARTWIAVAAAASLVALLAIFAWKRATPAAPFDREAALARIADGGRTGVCTGGVESARAFTDREAAQGLEYGSVPVSILTAKESGARVWLASAGRLQIEPSTRIDVSGGPDGAALQGGAPSAALALDLERGKIDLERYAAGAGWRVHTSEGTLVLDRGAIAIASVVDGDGSASRGVRARLRSGAAHLDANGAIVALALATETTIRGGAIVATTSLDGGAGGDESSGELARRESAATATGEGEPDASTEAAVSKPTATLHARLTHASGTKLPAEITITLLRDERLPQVSRPEPHVIAHADGAPDELTIDGIRPGTYSVFAEVRGFATWQQRGIALRPVGPGGNGAAEISIDLVRGSIARGVVRDALTGAPIEGALVVSQRDAPTQLLPLTSENGPAGCLATTLTGPDGSFELAALSRGRHVLRATKAGHAAAWSQPIEIAAESARDGIQLALGPGATIYGHATHPDGSPWSAAYVVASRLDYDFDSHVMSVAYVTADADGAYAITDLPGGPYVVLNVLEAQRSGDIVTKSPHVAQVDVPAGGRVEVDLGATRHGTRVTGKLFSPSGTPVAGLDIVIMPHGTRGNRNWQSERTDADGSFVFPDVAPASYDVLVSEAMGEQLVLQEEEVAVTAGPTLEHDVRMVAGEITGRVVEASSGKPIANVVLILGGDLDGGHHFFGRAVTDVDGRYALHSLRPATYRVVAYSVTGRLGQEARDGLSVSASKPSAQADFALAAGASLAVTVVEGDRQAIGGDRRAIEDAHLSFVDESGTALQFSPEDVTDAHGRFAIPGMKSGRWRVSAAHDGYRASSTSVDLAPGEDRALEIVLDRLEKH